MAIAFAISALALPAEAGMLLGIEIEGASDTGSWAVKPGGMGLGFEGRLGYELPIPVIRLIPELAVGVSFFPADVENENIAQRLETYRAGGRIGLAGVGPAAYFHYGYGRLSGEGVSEEGPALALGVSLDVTLVPVINFGAHAGFNNMASVEERVGWFDIGGHIEVKF